MWKSFKRFMLGPTVEEARIAGANLVDKALKGAVCPEDEADHLYALAYGGFNTKPAHKAFDEGVQDRLEELGYKCPY